MDRVDYTKEVPQRRARGGHRPRAGRVARHGLQVRGWRTSHQATQGEEGPRRWTGGRRSWTSGSQTTSGRTEEAGHTAHRVWRQQLVDECGADVFRADRQARYVEAGFMLGGAARLLPRPRLARGVAQVDFGHAAFVVLGHGREMPFFVASFPLLQRGARPGVPRRERGVRVPEVSGTSSSSSAASPPGSSSTTRPVNRRVCDRVPHHQALQTCSAHYGFSTGSPPSLGF